MEPFIGQIIMFGGNFAPKGWAFCNGQALNIKDYPALFSIVGTTYGGDGRVTFALPDLRGRVPLHQAGRAEGVSSKKIGQKGGTEDVQLSLSQMPVHTHDGAGTIRANNGQSDSTSPENAYPSTLTGESKGYSKVANTDMIADGVNVENSNSGGSRPHNNMQPYLCVNFIIALEGVFPSRS